MKFKERNAIVLIADARISSYVKFMSLQLEKYRDVDKFFMSNDTFGTDTMNMVDRSGIRFIDLKRYSGTISEMNREDKRRCGSHTYFKFLIPFIDELKEYRKILFLDCDIEITSNLMEIFDIDLKDYDIGGVPEYNIYNSKYWSGYLGSLDKRMKETLKHTYFMNNSPYINAGVILFNNEAISKTSRDMLMRKIVHYIKWSCFCNTQLSDQDIFPVVFKIMKIPERFNILKGYQKEPGDMVIRHHIGDKKPDFDKLVTRTLSK